MYLFKYFTYYVYLHLAPEWHLWY